MKKKWNILLYILSVMLIVGGLLALWLPNRNGEENADATRPDTDPDAPFEDLPDLEKERVLKAISKYWAKSEKPGLCPDDLFWYGELSSGQEPPLTRYNYEYGVQYYGTFGGYYIILSPQETMNEDGIVRTIAGYRFKYGDYYDLFAYKNGVARRLEEIYKEGLLDDEKIELIHQCYERYLEEIYLPNIRNPKGGTK